MTEPTSPDLVHEPVAASGPTWDTTSWPGGYVGVNPFPVGHKLMVHRWDRLTFLHWRYDPAVVQALLPPDLRVETFDGSAWVGLVPFLMEIRPGAGPALPWISHFCETNVRTYVRGADGSVGVWFLSLDAARLAAVVTARVGYRLPYFWSAMRLTESHRGGEHVVTYRSHRRWPGPRGATTKVSIRVGDAYSADELTELDHYLTARWRLFSPAGIGPVVTPTSERPGPVAPVGIRSGIADHGLWPLHRAEVVELHDELMEAGGLPAPVGPPIVHWSPGVEVDIGWPHRLPDTPA